MIGVIGERGRDKSVVEKGRAEEIISPIKS